MKFLSLILLFTPQTHSNLKLITKHLHGLVMGHWTQGHFVAIVALIHESLLKGLINLFSYNIVENTH